jgi:hypothetical protein
MAHAQSGLEVVASTPDYSLPQPHYPAQLSTSTDPESKPPYHGPSYDQNGQYAPAVNTAYIAPDENLPESSKHQRICGLTPLFYGIVVASVAAIVVGIALGVGLGTQLAKQNTSDSSSTSARVTVTSFATALATVTVTATRTGTASQPSATGLATNFVAVKHGSIASLSNPCPAANGTVYVTPDNQVFRANCEQSLDGADISNVWAFSQEDCIDACASFNSRAVTNASCAQILWTRNMQVPPSNQFGNCWLKTSAARLKPRNDDTIMAVLNGR